MVTNWSTYTVADRRISPFRCGYVENLWQAGIHPFHHIFPEAGWFRYSLSGPERVPGSECYFLKGAVNGWGSWCASRLKAEEHYVVSVLPVSSLFLRANEDEVRSCKEGNCGHNPPYWAS